MRLNEYSGPYPVLIKGCRSGKCYLVDEHWCVLDRETGADAAIGSFGSERMGSNHVIDWIDDRPAGTVIQPECHCSTPSRHDDSCAWYRWRLADKA